MLEQLSVMPSPYPRLFEPGYIGSLRLKNRIVMPPMGTQFASDTGGVTPRLIEHYVRRARGGVGLIIVEFTCIDYPRGKGHYSQLALHDDKLLAGHANLVEAVHRAGSKIAIQLHHAGGNTDRKRTEGLELVAPSKIPSRLWSEQPRVLTVPEIEELIERFARAVERAKKAGYDAVELHGAHGYLIAEFMSPYINTRTDEYGGSFENRMRFPVAVVRRAKELVGQEFPLTMRFSGQEFVPGGRSLDESKQVAATLERAGLAALHVSAGVDTDINWMVDPISAPQGSKVHLSAAIKSAVNIPVICVGVIREPSFAENVLAANKADFVAVGRGLLSDPDWPLKAAQGRDADIRKCISCNYCDGVRNTAGFGIRCVMNTELGRGEAAATPAKVSRAKRVLVVGGGPAGMEAARTASLRGHVVTLCEKSDSLGGQIRLAAKAPGKDKLQWLIDDLARELARAPAEVRTGFFVEPETVRRICPDVLVLATGGEPLVPAIPGVDADSVFTAWSVLGEGIQIRDSRCVVIGGNSTGCEVALWLAEWPGNSVTLLEQESEFARDMEPFALAAMRGEIYGNPNIQVVVNAKVVQIVSTGVEATMPGGLSAFFEADKVILATGVRSVTAQHSDLLAAGSEQMEAYSVGDATSPGTIASALEDGRAVGALI